MNLLSQFSIKGRINRLLYWQASALLIIFYVILFAAYFNIIDELNRGARELFSGIFLFIFIAALCYQFCIISKRLHDRNYSAWWSLFFLILPNVLILIKPITYEVMVEYNAGNSAIEFVEKILIYDYIIVWIGAIIGLSGFAELCFRKGTVGQNKYGPDPLATPSTADEESPAA